METNLQSIFDLLLVIAWCHCVFMGFQAGRTR